MAAHRVEFQDLSFGQTVFRAPKTKGVFDAVPLKTCVSAALPNFFEKTADVDADAQVGPNQLLDHLLKGVEVCKHSLST